MSYRNKVPFSLNENGETPQFGREYDTVILYKTGPPKR